MSNINIVGILITAFPQHLSKISEQIQNLGGEVHLQDEHGKLVVTLETASDSVIAERLVDFQNIPGVINAAMVYHEIVAEE